MKASRTRKHVIIIISCAAAPFLADLDPVSSFQFQSPLSPPSPSRIRHGPFRPLRHHIHLQPPSFDDDGIHRQYRGESPSILNEREAPPEDMSRRVFFMKSLAALAVATTAAMTTTSEDVAEAAADVAAVESAAASLTPSVSEGELTISNPPPNRARVVDIDEDTTINDPLQSSTSTAVESEAITTDATTAIVDATTTSRVKNKPSSDPRYFLAGGLSAAISHGITTPIDVVKTRMQSDSSLSSLSPQTAALQIYQRDGPSALAAGLGPTVLGYGVEGALKFGVYESLKPALLSLLAPSAGDPTQPYLVAAVCAGALASIVLCPMEETRIRLVTDPEFGAEGLWDGLPALLGEEGPLMPFRRGILPMLSKQVPYTVGKQVSFDVFAGMLYGWLAALGVLTTEGGPMGMIPQQEVALGVEIGAAFLASLVACLASHPGDVLLTATYKNGKNGEENGGYSSAGDADANNENTGFGATISKVYQEGGGIAAFFRGLNARFFHVGCIITFQLVIYDQVKQFLGLPASGAH